jgi:glycosyltransferase involved in cell wall biosynthesis
MRRELMLVSDASATCGVEEFARQSALRVGGAITHVLGAPGFLQKLGLVDGIVLNLPVVAWKRRLLAPIGAAMMARARGRGVTLVLHEWADLALARRISYLPLLPLATRVLFSAPEVRAQFEATPISKITTGARAVVPIPPNFTVPGWTHPTALSEALAADRARGTLVLAQFGSIYPKKDPLVLLEVLAELAQRGVAARLVQIGSFIGEAIEAEFFARAAALGVADRVAVSGYVASAPELYALFAEVDVFVYPLSEGLTSRRGSVLAAAMSGRPVVVSAPARADALAHHALFQSLQRTGSLQFAPRAASPQALADAVLAARGTPPRPMQSAHEIEALWRDVADRLVA